MNSQKQIIPPFPFKGSIFSALFAVPVVSGLADGERNVSVFDHVLNLLAHW